MTFDEWIENEYFGKHPTGLECVGRERMTQILEAACAAEREACAKVCLDVRDQDVRGGNDSYLEGRQMGATVCMNTIRMRSNAKLTGAL